MTLFEKIVKVSDIAQKPKPDGDVNTDFLAQKKYRTIEAVIKALIRALIKALI